MDKRDNTLVWVCFALIACITIQMVGTMSLKSQIRDLESQVLQLKKKNEVGK
jgi:uncharacterized protein YpmS